jgi:hypothetical protein
MGGTVNAVILLWANLVKVGFQGQIWVIIYILILAHIAYQRIVSLECSFGCVNDLVKSENLKKIHKLFKAN